MDLRVCVLASGSSGNAIYIGSKKTNILIDCGVTRDYLVKGLEEEGVNPGSISDVLVTHEHRDHVCGVGAVARSFEATVHLNSLTYGKCKNTLGKILPSFIHEFDHADGFEIGDLWIQPFPVPHDAIDPVGYSIGCGNLKIVVATDLGHVSRVVQHHIRDCDFLILESNHDVNMLTVGPYPWHLKRRILGNKGHLSNDDTGTCLASVLSGRTKRVLLAHLSEENNFPELAITTVKSHLASAGIEAGRDVILDVALQGARTTLYKVSA